MSKDRTVTRGFSYPIFIVAGCGAFLCAIALVSMYWGPGDLSFLEVLASVGLAGLTGMAIGFAVWVLRPRYTISLAWLVLSRGLLGGAIAWVSCVCFVAVTLWVNPVNFGGRGSPPPRFSGRAASDALVWALLGGITTGWAMFALGAIAGAAAAPFTRVPHSLDGKEKERKGSGADPE